MPAVQNPICVYCGTSRPANIPNCVRCGQPWIDHRVVADAPVASRPASPPIERTVVGAPPPQPTATAVPAPQPAAPVPAAAPQPAAPAAAASTATPTASDRTQVMDRGDVAAFDGQGDPDEGSDSKVRPLMLGFGIGLIMIAVFVFFLNSNSSDTPTTTVVASPTTTVDATPATTLTQPPATTTAPATTTTTSTIPPPPLPEAIGEPIPVADLQLAAFFMGPLGIGDAADDVLGRLIATFGEPDSHQVIDGTLGLCPGQTGVSTTWGPLAVITADDAFVAYRLEDFAADHPASALETLSGLQVGDTVADLELIYSGLIVDLLEAEGRFELSTDGGDLLLWGPVTSVEPEGVVSGIYSPNACEGSAG